MDDQEMAFDLAMKRQELIQWQIRFDTASEQVRLLQDRIRYYQKRLRQAKQLQCSISQEKFQLRLDIWLSIQEINIKMAERALTRINQLLEILNGR